jgi:hypothetical protein
LEGYGSTVELHPQYLNDETPFTIHFSSIVFSFFQWGVKDSNLRRHCHQIYSLTPLTARETPLAKSNNVTSAYWQAALAPVKCDLNNIPPKSKGGDSMQASGGT